jgi:hypothetical protein
MVKRKRSNNIYKTLNKTKDRVRQIPLKSVGELNNSILKSYVCYYT